MNAGDAVMPRQPLVQESIVGAQEIEETPILAEHALEEKVRFSGECSPEVFIEIRKCRRIR